MAEGASARRLPERVAVTGATGFIGRALLRRLAREGVAVRALCRTLPTSSASHIDPGNNIEWVRGDLSSVADLELLASKSGAFVHCAGAVRGATWDAFYRTNVVGTMHAVSAANAVGTPFLYFSSLAARQPQLSFYARSKHEAERHVLGHGKRASVLRPPAVYGEGDRELKPLLDAMWRGLAVVPHHEGRFSLIHVEDLVTATLAWLATPECPGGPFEIDDGRPGGYTWTDVIETVAGLARRRVRTLNIPRGALMVPATLNALVGRLGIGVPMITPGKVRELFHTDWLCTTGTFEAATQWRPRIPLREGLAGLYCAQGK